MGITLIDPTQIKGLAGYNFSRTNGTDASGNLSASGAGNVITVTGMPFGLAIGYKVRISGGTGTAEQATITAVSGVGGASTGTITVTTANPHTGAWVVSSATAGIQEAIVVAGIKYTLIQMPAGILNLYTGVIVPSTAFTAIRGAGMGITNLAMNGLTGDWITFDQCEYVDLGDFTLYDSTNTFHTAGAGIKVLNVPRGVVSNIEIYRAFDGLWPCGGQAVFYNNIRIEANRYGWFANTNGQAWASIYDASNIHVSSNGGSGFNPQSFRLEGVTAGVRMSHLFGYNGAAADPNYEALDISLADGSHATNEINITNVELEGPIVIQGFGTFSNNSITIANGRINCDGEAYALVVQAAMNGIKFSNLVFVISNSPIAGGILINKASNLTFEAITLICPGAANGVQFAGTGNFNILFSSCLIGHYESTPVAAPTCGVALANADNVQFADCNVRGLTFGYNISTGLTNVHLSGGRAQGATPLANAGSVSLIIDDVAGISDVIPVIASGTTITQPPNPTCSISGTTTITTITPMLAPGSRLRLTKADAGSVTIGGGGNIPGSHTLAQYGGIDLVWNGTAWL